MKTNFFKIVMQASAVLLAVGGSLATHASQKKAATAVPGYITVNPAIPCGLQVPCTSLAGPLCTAIISGVSRQAWGKVLPTDTFCQIERYKIPG